MSKPDPAGGSLESILASIRKSLTEQSTDALSETAAAPADQDKDARPPRKGLTQRLAGATAAASSGDPVPAVDDLSDLLEGPPDQAVPAPESAPVSDAARPVASPAAAGEQDPLWFLTRRDEPAPDISIASSSGRDRAPVCCYYCRCRAAVHRAQADATRGAARLHAAVLRFECRGGDIQHHRRSQRLKPRTRRKSREPRPLPRMDTRRR